MKENEINNTAFLFIELLETTIGKKKYGLSEINTGSSQDHLQFIDLTDKVIEGPFIETVLNHDNIVTTRKVSIGDKSYQFNLPNFKKYQEFIREIHSIQIFKQNASFQFLEEKTLSWMINVKSSGKANTCLTSYLMDETDKATEEVTYYFHVVNLHIFAPFKIGNVNLTFFTKEYFDDFWENFENKDEVSKDDFDGLYRKYQGWVFAAFEISAEPQRGKEIAYEECSRAIDVLKCFTTTNLFPSKKCYMDLSDRLNVNFQSDSLARPKSEKYELRLSFSAKNDPFIIKKELYFELQKLGLKILSDFITNKPRNELGKLISQAISFYSYSISTTDLHLRISHLITIYESLLLEYDRKYKMEASVKKRIKKLLPTEGLQYYEYLEVLFGEMYQVRHKMVHKATRIHLNMDYVREFQLTTVEMIKALCQLNNSLTSKEQLIEYLDKTD